MTAVHLQYGSNLRGVRDRWRALREAEPGVRARDAAATLGVSEAELVASSAGDTVVPLDQDFAALLHALPAVGRTMALTRNDHVVSEVRGCYGGVALGPHAGQVVGQGVDLRVFMEHWRFGFALAEPHPQRAGQTRRSIQVFDAAGVAVHKIYLEPEGDPVAWDAIVGARSILPPPELEIAPPPRPKAERSDQEVDGAALMADWDAMTDTHEFFHLLRKHDVTRVQAMRLAGATRARAVPLDTLGRTLEAAATAGLRIMIFVGNRGCLQIYSGQIRRVVRVGDWLNVLDPEFNLHLREDRVAAAWVVRKPTRSGLVTSLEVYDSAGETMALLFCKRNDRDRAENSDWSELLEQQAGAA